MSTATTETDFFEQSVYTPPETTLTERSVEEAPLFAVGLPKLIAMHVLTFGAYLWYWHYKQWKAIAADEKVDISPLLRSMVPIIFVPSVFGRIRDRTSAAGIAYGPSVTALATLFILLRLTIRIQGHLPSSFLSPFLVYTWMLTVIPVAYMQREINQFTVQYYPDSPRNESFTAKTLVACALGLLSWAFVYFR